MKTPELDGCFKKRKFTDGSGANSNLRQWLMIAETSFTTEGMLTQRKLYYQMNQFCDCNFEGINIITITIFQCFV